MKHWNRRLAALALALTVWLAAALPALAASEPVLQVQPQSQQVQQGDTVQVEVQLSGLTEKLGGLQFTLSYDPALLEYQGYQWGGLYAEDALAATVHSAQEGELRMAFLSEDNRAGEGTVLRFDFLALSQTGTSALTLSGVDLVSAQPVQRLTVSVTDGSVEVLPPASPSPSATTSASPSASPTASATATHHSSDDDDDDEEEDDDEATPTPAPAVTPAPVAAPAPAVTPARTARATAAPTTAPTAAASATPSPTAAPEPTNALTPSPSLTPVPSPTEAPEQTSQPPSLLWLLALAIGLALITGVIVYRSSRRYRQ